MGEQSADQGASADTPWWSHAVFYQVYPRSFADSNGDGVGDLDGVAGRLDYLKALGVDAIWINPVTVSPMADHGYDVADPRDVDPLFGGMAALERLIVAAHQRDIKITMDLVPKPHQFPAPMVSGGAGRRPRQCCAGSLHLSRRWRGWWAPAAQQLGVGVRRAGLDLTVYRVLFGASHWVLDWKLTFDGLDGKPRGFDCLDVVEVSPEGLVARKDTFIDSVQAQEQTQ